MKKILTALFLFSFPAFATADTYVGKVTGGMKGYSDIGSIACCAQLSALLSDYGINYMSDNCRVLGGDTVRNIQANGYCATYAADTASGYRYACSAPAIGDCYSY